MILFWLVDLTSPLRLAMPGLRGLRRVSLTERMGGPGLREPQVVEDCRGVVEPERGCGSCQCALCEGEGDEQDGVAAHIGNAQRLCLSRACWLDLQVSGDAACQVYRTFAGRTRAAALARVQAPWG
jgi:hypothetical protein